MKNQTAPRLIPPPFQELVRRTKEPYIQPIYDLTVPQMVVDRILLLGDAAFVPRPHTGAGVNKAAINALSLAEHLPEYSKSSNFLHLKGKLKQWEEEQMAYGRDLVRTGKGLGDRFGLGYGGQRLS